MYARIVTIAALAALSEQALAYNHNRRHTHPVDKRALEVEWVTVWETVYVTEGQAPVPTQPVVDPVLPTVTSTSVVVVPTTTAPPALAPPAPTSAQTTLVTSIAPQPAQPVEEEPKPEPVTEAPVVEAPAVVEPEETPAEEPAEQPEQQEPEKEEESDSEQDTPASPSQGVPSKRGMAYNSASLANSFNSACESCSWAYNWGSSTSELDSSISFVPMCWGEKAFGHWFDDADAALAAGSKALLSFNEPDHADQAAMAPAAAAQFHKEYMNKYSGKALIGAPAVTNGGGEMGLTWLKNFFAACEAQEGGCAVDFCPVHWYSEAQYADTLLTHIEEAHEICGGKPVWLTEFAPLGSADQISEFMTNMIPKLDAIEYLDAYSYFWVDTSSLMSSESALSGFGQIYATI